MPTFVPLLPEEGMEEGLPHTARHTSLPQLTQLETGSAACYLGGLEDTHAVRVCVLARVCVHARVCVCMRVCAHLCVCECVSLMCM